MLRAAPTTRPWYERLSRGAPGRTAACLLAATGVLLVLAWPLFSARVYCGDDLGAYHLPTRYFYSQTLSQGDAFDWWPDIYCGFYLTGEGQAGMYHPWHYLLYRSLPLTVAFDLEVISVYPFLWLGTFLFLRQLLRRADAAAFGALVFTFGSFNLLHLIQINAVAVVAHLPWLLWALRNLRAELGRGRPRTSTLLVLSMGTASQVLLGYPQYVWFTALAEAAFLIALLRQPATTPSTPNKRFVAYWSAGKFTGLLIGAVQWLPTAEALADSTRQSVTADFVNSGAWHPLNMVQLVAPYALQSRVIGQNTHELGAYCGAVAVALVAWLLGNRSTWGRQRTLILGTLGLGLVALALACGQHLGLYRLQTLLPVVGKFRFPCRTIVLFQLAVAILAAIAVVKILRAGRSRTPASFLPLRFVVALAFLAAFAIAILVPNHAAAPAYLALGPALVLAAAGMIYAVAQARRWAWPALALFAAVDLGAYGLSYSVFSHTLSWSDYATPVCRPTAEQGSRLALPVRQPGQYVGNRLTVAGWKRSDGYAGLEPAKALDYTNPVARQIAGVREVIPNDQTLLPPLDRATLYNDVQVVVNPDRGLAHLDPQRTALVARSLSIDKTATGHAEIRLDRPGRIHVEALADGPLLLVINETWHRGWQVRINDCTADVERCFGDFIGCVVPAGAARVEFTFQPDSLRYGRRLTAVGLCLLVGVIVWNSRCRFVRLR